jgi:hypothetical protein
VWPLFTIGCLNIAAHLAASSAAARLSLKEFRAGGNLSTTFLTIILQSACATIGKA